MRGTFKPVPEPILEVPAQIRRHRISQQMRETMKTAISVVLLLGINSHIFSHVRT